MPLLDQAGGRCTKRCSTRRRPQSPDQGDYADQHQRAATNTVMILLQISVDEKNLKGQGRPNVRADA
jgi:hypothetical protein